MENDEDCFSGSNDKVLKSGLFRISNQFWGTIMMTLYLVPVSYTHLGRDRYASGRIYERCGISGDRVYVPARDAFKALVNPA